MQSFGKSRQRGKAASSSLAAAEKAAHLLHKASKLRPELAIILGTGFQDLSDAMDANADLAYAKLPGFLKPAVSGHAGRVLIGTLGGVPVVVLSGRVHYYEGHSMSAVTHGVRVLAAYGIRDLLLTNAAGAINRKFRQGQLMLIKDHINLMGTNPLIGCDPQLPRFIDMTRAYDPELSRLLELAGRSSGILLRGGIYLAVSGPTYETPAEIRAFRRLGADAVGMSTVPEVIAARQCGLRVAAISCLTNMAAGITDGPLSHHDVLEVGRRAASSAVRLLTRFGEIYAKRV